VPGARGISGGIITLAGLVRNLHPSTPQLLGNDVTADVKLGQGTLPITQHDKSGPKSYGCGFKLLISTCAMLGFHQVCSHQSLQFSTLLLLSAGYASPMVILYGATRPGSRGWIGVDWGCLDALLPCDIEAEPSGFQVVRRVQASSRSRKQLDDTRRVSQGTEKVRLVPVASILSLVMLGVRHCVPRIWSVQALDPKVEHRMKQRRDCNCPCHRGGTLCTLCRVARDFSQVL